MYAVVVVGGMERDEGVCKGAIEALSNLGDGPACEAQTDFPLAANRLDQLCKLR